MDATDILPQFNELNLNSEKVMQHILILTGAEDHFIPLKIHYKQVRTQECQIGDYSHHYKRGPGTEQLPDREHRACP